MSANESDPPHGARWPCDFESWPRSKQVDVVESRMTRSGLIHDMLNMADIPVEEKDDLIDRRLTKKELAGIYLAIQGVDHDG